MEHGIHRLLETLELSFCDLDPRHYQDKWGENVEPWGKPITDLTMTREQAKQLWSLLRRQKEAHVWVIVDSGGQDGRAMSTALALCDAMRLPRGRTLYRPDEEEWKADENDIAPNRHVYETVKDGRSMVL